MSPTTFPGSLHTPATSATEPFEGTPNKKRNRICRPASSSSSSPGSANQQPSPFLTGIVSDRPVSHREVNGVSFRSTRERHVATHEGERLIGAQHAREQPGLE